MQIGGKKTIIYLYIETLGLKYKTRIIFQSKYIYCYFPMNENDCEVSLETNYLMLVIDMFKNNFQNLNETNTFLLTRVIHIFHEFLNES